MLHPSQGFLKCGSWHSWGFPDGTVVKNLPASAGDTGDASLISGLGRFPNLGNGNALQYFCLENPRDRAACQAAVHPVTKSWAKLSTHSLALGTAASESQMLITSDENHRILIRWGFKKKKKKIPRPWDSGGCTGDLNLLAVDLIHLLPSVWETLPSALSVKATLVLRVLLLSCQLERSSSFPSWGRLQPPTADCWLPTCQALLSGYTWRRGAVGFCGLHPFPLQAQTWKIRALDFASCPYHMWFTTNGDNLLGFLDQLPHTSHLLIFIERVVIFHIFQLHSSSI